MNRKNGWTAVQQLIFIISSEEALSALRQEKLGFNHSDWTSTVHMYCCTAAINHQELLEQLAGNGALFRLSAFGQLLQTIQSPSPFEWQLQHSCRIQCTSRITHRGISQINLSHSPEVYPLQTCVCQVVIGPFVDVPLLLNLVVIRKPIHFMDKHLKIDVRVDLVGSGNS